MNLNDKQLRNFWRKVRKTGDCWIWTGGKDKNGYGTFGVNYKKLRAHRVSFAIAHGRMPRLDVLHSCDNTSCVNPRHLFEGTKKDNMVDMAMKGRQWRQKLTQRQVLEIRAARGTLKDIAKRFGVSGPHVSLIKHNRTWSWL